MRWPELTSLLLLLPTMGVVQKKAAVCSYAQTGGFSFISLSFHKGLKRTGVPSITFSLYSDPLCLLLCGEDTQVPQSQRPGSLAINQAMCSALLEICPLP